MRMNRDNKIKASDILAKNDETELAAIFYNFGELRESRKIARLIVQARKSGLIETVSDLRSAIDKLAPPVDENRFYARVFQALRIAVNHELDYLKEMLEQVPGLLKQGGRLAIITYHSLEDRLVKDFMKTGNIHGREEKDFYGNRQTIFRLITRKAIVPCEDEILRNPRSRSAKLRIAEKI
jgi:16S rRNA (cytosine1402-N4)-methyltransferase